MKKNKKGFTLVELLAVIVILAVILIIAMPKITDVIKNSKIASFESSAKTIAAQAEKKKMEKEILEDTGSINCSDVVKLNNNDYSSCSITFDGNTAKVSLVGQGKFEGMNICEGTKENTVVTAEECPEPKEFATDDWKIIVDAIKSGTYPYQVGDEKAVDLGSLGTHILRVANTTPCDGTLSSKTACGFVLEFKDIITTYNMNPAGEYSGTRYNFGTNLGGWPASAMRTYVNDTIYNAMPVDLRNGIISTIVVSSHGSKDTGTLDKGNFTSTDKLYLLSPEEVYGTSFTNTHDSSRGTSRQLDYYANNGVSTSSYSGAIKQEAGSNSWWLRSAASTSANSFFHVSTNGDLHSNFASNSRGVSPAFRIA